MAHVDRMIFRLSLPCVAAIAIAGLLAWVAEGFSTWPAALGGRPLWPDAPALIVAAGIVVALLVLAVQSWRVWRWHNGHGLVCFVCSCLLGGERKGRWGDYRKCLGCGKNHSTARAYLR